MFFMKVWVKADLPRFRKLFWVYSRSNNAVVWIDSVPSLIAISSRKFYKPLGIVHSTLNTIGITDTFMFYSFFRFLARSKYSHVFSDFPSIILCQIHPLCRLLKRQSTKWQVLSCLLISSMSIHLAGIS